MIDENLVAGVVQTIAGHLLRMDSDLTAEFSSVSEILQFKSDFV
jgi:hypothetical protein